MPTKNPRINVTFDNEVVVLLNDLANRQHQSVASLVRKLTLEALDTHEDVFLSRLAEKLDQKGVKTVGHDEAWK